jgi:hypothetical protein
MYPGVGIIGGVYYQARVCDDSQGKEWLHLLATGERLDVGHPVMLLRNRLQDMRSSKAKLPPYEVAALCVKSFNAFSSGARPKLLRWTEDEAFPHFNGALDTRAILEGK